MENQTEMLSIDNNRNFINLVKYCNEQYNSLIKVELPNNSNDRINYWKSKLTTESIIKQALNPFFIGYGNPNAELLILGKEKGFDIANTDQVILESIENTFYWYEIVNKRPIDVELHNFGSPLKPYGGIHEQMKGGETWNLYQKLINHINVTDDRNSFLQHAFLTEFNYMPSKYSPGGVKIDSRRKEVLRQDFFKSFPNVLLTYRSYDKHNIGLTEELFDVEFVDRSKVGRQEYLLYSSKDQNRKVVLTNQLSGSAGWSDNELQELANKFSDNSLADA